MMDIKKIDKANDIAKLKTVFFEYRKLLNNASQLNTIEDIDKANGLLVDAFNLEQRIIDLINSVKEYGDNT